MAAILVTGTDTGIGKTMVTCAMAAALVRDAVSVGVYKPVETGCARQNDRLFGADARRLVAAAGGAQAEASVTGYLFEMAAAPLAAARAAGEVVDPGRLEQDIVTLGRAHRVALVEGAGGLLVPIADEYTYLDLALRVSLPVIVVVGSKLGCVNHALLTMKVLAGAGVRALGYILNQLAPDTEASPSVDSNRELISAFTDTPCLGVFPFVHSKFHSDLAHLATVANAALDLSPARR